MGCNKSKSQEQGSGAYVSGDHTNQWELDQEAHSYSGNFELNQNGNANNGYHSNSSFNHNISEGNFRVNSGYHAGLSSSNINFTGSFGVAAPVYNPYSGIGYLNTNEYNVNECNQRGDGLTSSNNYLNNNFRHEQVQRMSIVQLHCQSPFNNQQPQSMFNREQLSGTLDQEHIMRPPSRPISVRSNYNIPQFSRPLARCSSFNDDYRRARYKTPNNNVMAIHGSLENIQTGFRSMYSRHNFSSDDYLFQNSSFDNERYPRGFRSRHRNRGERIQQRGLKRSSWDDDSLNSNSTLSNHSEPFIENVNMSDAGPRVKRRPSNVDDQADVSNQSYRKGEEEISSNVKAPIRLESVDQPNFDSEPFDILDLLMFPEEWSSCAIGRTGFVDISLTSPEGKSVRGYFSRSSQSKDFKLCITEIARIENPFMHSYYLLKKQEMESRNEHVDELYLYHGTKKEHLSGILEDNLNWRLYSEKHRFGQGVSFSPLATYSSHYSDKTHEKVMLLFKVLVSNSIGGSPDMNIPPIVDNIVYDASVKEDTTVIVKYSDNEFYPLYRISYTKISRNC